MQKKYLYPEALPWTTSNNESRVSAAIKLMSMESIQLKQWESLHKRSAVEEHPLAPLHLHEKILRDLVELPSNTEVSLNIITHPLPALPMGGTIEIVFVITGGSEKKTQKEIVAHVLRQTLSLMLLLTSYHPETEFEYVTDRQELEKLLHPFSPSTVFRIGRRRQKFRLVKSPTDVSHSVGFLCSNKINTSVKEQQQKPEHAVWINYLYPWRQDGHLNLTMIYDALLAHPSPLWYQVRLRPGKADEKEIETLEQQLFDCEDLLASQTVYTKNSLLISQANALRAALADRIEHLNQRVFKGGVFLVSASPLDEALVAAVANEISCTPIDKNDSQLTLKGGVTISSLPTSIFFSSDCFSMDSYTIEEAACAFRMPTGTWQDPPGLPIRHYRTALLSPHLMGKQDGELLLGFNRHRGGLQEVWLTAEDRMRHMAIMGQTGTGKSVFLESLVLQDIRQGRGCCFIDPHGDSIEKLLQMYPKERIKDLVLIDFQVPNQILPFNVLRYQTAEERDRLIDDLYAWMDLQYDMRQAGGPMFELYYRTLMMLLLPDKPRQDFVPVMQDFARLFTDDKFRSYCNTFCCSSEIQDQILHFQAMTGDASFKNIGPYVFSKFNRFLGNRTIKLMTAQEDNILDFDTFMSHGKVVLINLGRKVFGEITTSFLASQIVSRLQTSTMRRIALEPEKRPDFYLYIDEFQNVASASFTSLLSEARKFRLGLVLANQYADQLNTPTQAGGSNSVLSAILGNVGSIISFRLGVKDAKIMEDVFRPTFMAPDLVNLPIGNCYANIKARSKNPCSFSMETRPVTVDSNTQEQDILSVYRSSITPSGAMTLERAEHARDMRNMKISMFSK